MKPIRPKPNQSAIDSIANPQNPYTRKILPSFSEKKSISQMVGNKPLAPLIFPAEKTYSHSSSRADAVRLANKMNLENEFEKMFDQFLVESVENELDEIIEKFFKKNLRARNVTYWHDVPSLHVLYSKKLKLVQSHAEGLVGFTFCQRETVTVVNPSEHPSYNATYDQCPDELQLTMLLFPLWDNLGNVCSVVQVTRPRNDLFEGKKELEMIKYFSRKFAAVYPVLFHTPRPDNYILEFMKMMDIEEFLFVLHKQMESLCKCRCVEVWKYDKTTNEMFQYQKTKKQIDPDQAGIVGDAIVKGFPINCLENRMMSSYSEEVDGVEVEPVLVLPINYPKRKVIYALCVRGGKDLPVFSKHDEELIKIIAPYAFLAVDNIENYNISENAQSEENELTSEKQCVDGLIDIIDYISSKAIKNQKNANSSQKNNSKQQTSQKQDEETVKIDTSKIIQSAVEKMGLITKADKSTWYVSDKKTMALKALFCTNQNIKTETISNRTIPARVFANQEVFSIADAYDDFEFDSSIDLETGYKTTSLLAVPVMNGQSDVVGVLEFCNRLDNKPFPEKHLVKYIRILSTFVAVLLDNERLQKELLSSSRELRTYLSITLQNSSDGYLHGFFKNILRNIRRKNTAESSAIYLLDEEKNKMMRFVDESERSLQMTLPTTYGVSAIALRTKEPVVANDAKNDSRCVKDPLDNTGIVIKNIVACPIVSFHGKPFGVIEFVNKDGDFSGKDVNIIKSLSILIAVCFEERRLHEIGAHGNVLFETNRWIDEVEKHEVCIPEKLGLITKQEMESDSLYFDSLSWPFPDLFKIGFYVFDSLGLLAVYNITCEVLFCFLYQVRDTYSHTFHGWARAIDVLQFVNYTIKSARLLTRLNNAEIIGLCIAALCFECNFEDLEMLIFQHMYLGRPQSDDSDLYANSTQESFNLKEHEDDKQPENSNETKNQENKHDKKQNNTNHGQKPNQASTNNDVINPADIPLYNKNLEIAESILHADKSGFTSKRCSTVINILTNYESNILKNLNEGELIIAWKVIIYLISSLDPRNHFTLLQNCRSFEKDLGNGLYKVEWQNESKKLIVLSLILKAATVSYVSRPEDIFDKWMSTARAEMREDKMFETSNDFLVSMKILEREKTKRRMKCTIAYMDLIALPVLATASLMIPQIKPAYDSALENLEKCKSKIPQILKIEAQEKEEEQRMKDLEETEKKNKNPETIVISSK